MEPTIRQLSDLHRYREDLFSLDLSTAPNRLVALDLVTTMESILGQIRDTEDEAEHLRLMVDMDRSILRIAEYGAQIRRTMEARECPIVTLNAEEDAAFDALKHKDGGVA